MPSNVETAAVTVLSTEAVAAAGITGESGILAASLSGGMLTAANIATGFGVGTAAMFLVGKGLDAETKAISGGEYSSYEELVTDFFVEAFKGKQEREQIEREIEAQQRLNEELAKARNKGVSYE